MSESQSALSSLTMHKFHSPQTVIGRFVARRGFRSAALWALAFGLYVASKAIGFVKTYPTAIAQQKAVATLSKNTGIKLLLGPIHSANTIGGYVAWNCLVVMVLIGGIWAILLATKMFRGEEDAGRAELLLSGQTTMRKAAVNTLVGLSACLALFYMIIAITFALVGKAHGVDFNVAAASYLALAVICGLFIFLMIGALASQLMPTRSRASSVSVAFFGIFFVLRGIADVSSLHWLLYFTPFGWIEKMQPLSQPQPIWIWPAVGLIFVLVGLTIYYAGKRDLGASTFADRDSAKPHFKLLKSPFWANFRLTRTSSISWLVAIGVLSLIYSLLTKAVTQTFSQSTSAEHFLNRITHQSHLTSALAFLGMVFLLQMIVIMCYAASAISALRRDEAEGYLDNILVRPYSRMRWLLGRISLILIVIILAGFVLGAGTWLGMINQNIGISFNTLIQAGANAIVPVIFTLGIGVFTFGIRPRLTSLLVYAVIAWSFLLEMISSGIKINHWILDTSLLNHIVFAPAASPNWATNLILIGIALVLGIIGFISFNKRDLANE